MRAGRPARCSERRNESSTRKSFRGISTAPFLVDERSTLAVPELDAGWNWGRRLCVLDIGNAGAVEHLVHLYARLAEWGFVYHKLDFLYAGALAGVGAYREGLELIRDAAGPEAILVGCGAPLLPSIGLVDAMRIGPDVLSESRAAVPDLAYVMRATEARRWMS